MLIPGKIGHKTLRYDSVTSTNEILRELAREGIESGTVVSSNIQTEGKGRMTRTWESPQGGLWMSVLLETEENFDNNKFGIIPLMSGCAVATAIMNEYNIEAGVKWPNDVLIDGRKVCGILGEVIKVEDKQMAIIGIGINVNNRIRENPEFGQTATSIIEERDRKSSIEELENAVLMELNHRNGLLAAGEYEELLDEWRELSHTLGRRVIISAPNEESEGLARDIDDNGSLILVMDDGSSRTVNVGDCRHLD